MTTAEDQRDALARAIEELYRSMYQIHPMAWMFAIENLALRKREIMGERSIVGTVGDER